MINDKKNLSMMTTENKRKTWLLVMAIVPILALAQAPSRQNTDSVKLQRHEFSAQQAADYARKNNVQVKNALLDVKMQEQVNREVTSAAYPHINASIGTTYNPNVATQVLPNFISPSVYKVLVDEGVNGSSGPIVMPGDFGFISAQFGTRYSANAGISLSQLLFDGQVFVGLQARSTVLDFQRKNVEVTEDLIKTNIYKIYYQLVVSKTQIEFIDENIALNEKLLSDTRAMFQNGFAEQLDVDRASVQLTNLQTERQRVFNTVSNGYYGLKVLMGMPVHDELVLTDTLNSEAIREGMLESANYNYEDRNDYQYAQLGKKLNEYNIRRYKLSQIPTISLNGTYAKNAQRNEYSFFGTGEWFTISNINLNVSIPIFNGFFTKSKIQQAKIELEQTNNQIQALQLTIDNEVATARNNFRTATATLRVQEKNKDLAEKVYLQTKKKFESGLASQTDINAAQLNMRGAQANYIDALYDAVVARIDFQKATGKL
jgi:outer membrane protein